MAALDLLDVTDFLNTVKLEEGTDELATASVFARWLRPERADVSRVPPTQLDLARRLRAALRSVAELHYDGAPPDRATKQELDALARRLLLRVGLDDHGRPVLVPAASGVPGYLAGVLGAVVSDPAGWARLKVCPAASCRWAFVDESRSGSRRWCSMEVCGNRSKARRYRQRAARDASDSVHATTGTSR
jgi:predicted RNA-binding Zn ribbon-like protein